MIEESVLSRPPIDEVIEQYRAELPWGDLRVTAEYAYAVAVRLREVGRADEAEHYARQCLQLMESLPANSLDDVVSQRQSVGGVPLPDHFHDGVVRSRLANLLGLI
ncbi:hypothetical protein [Paractinoplanes hotanensis]|uniref:Bacterial transcriptional activator domain-containing protein n=1 Tax=Paractinoplanes hotanensis TaxID=2906497 RepID=A0ABT0YFR3_9ACTN|nr:hypothetical protein [Actinoplanes hotanensis]MCM4084897.1 hypothetical protein [Actinoplanes hotanensis]